MDNFSAGGFAQKRRLTPLYCRVNAPGYSRLNQENQKTEGFSLHNATNPEELLRYIHFS